MTAPALQWLGHEGEAVSASADAPAGILARQLVRAVSQAPAEELPALVGALAQAQAVALARLTRPPAPVGEAPGPVRLLGLDEAERLTGMTRRWLLRHTRGLRFRRDLSRKAVRFEEAGLLRWLRCRG